MTICNFYGFAIHLLDGRSVFSFIRAKTKNKVDVRTSWGNLAYYEKDWLKKDRGTYIVD